MYCHDCGTGNTVDSKYCKECGTKINDGFRTMMLSVQDLAQGQSDEALDRLTRLLDMAFWHNEAGNIAAAITAGEAALAINPNSTTAHSLLGSLYEKKGEDDKAIEHFEAVLALNPNSQADASKLDQLRRGVHVRAVSPPGAHLWLPPGLVKMAPKVQEKWAAIAATRLDRPASLPRRPLYAAGGAALFVLACGLLVTRPWGTAEARTSTATAIPPAPSPAVAVDRSAFGAPPQAEAAAGSPPTRPLVLSGASAYTAPYAAPMLTSHDPFAGVVPSAPPAPRDRETSPLWSLPTVPARPSRSRRVAGRGLPALPLTLTAIPASSGELSPAPVTLPNGAPRATVEALPQHTVVVSSLGNAYAPSGTAELPSHIHITVHQLRSSDADPSAGSVGDGAGADGGQGDSYQQRALALQQGGDYRQARLAYGSAIRAYETQIASGHDVVTAQRGVAACQTGLQICQQSQ